MKTSRSFLIVIALLLATTKMQAQEIFDAVKKNDVEKVKELIEKDSRQIQAKDRQGYALLNSACNLGHIEIINFLIDKGADINLLAGRLDLTPLMECARTGNLGVAKLLVEKGADVQIINKMRIRRSIISPVNPQVLTSHSYGNNKAKMNTISIF
jgi:ankyrin repeat protein